MDAPPLPTIARLRASSAILYRVYDGPGFDLDEWVKLVPSGEAFWIVRTGYVEIRMGSRQWLVRPGEGMCLGTAARDQFFSADLQLLSINFVWKDADGRPHFPISEPHLFDAKANKGLARSAERFQRKATQILGNPAILLPSGTMDENDYQSLKGAFHLWLGSYGRFLVEAGVRPASDVEVDVRLLRARTLLDEAPLDVELDYTKIAARAGISRTHLERLFRVHYATTPHTYFQRRRANYACQALLQDEIPIKVIALNLGFHHLSRFSAWFSSREHHSPRDYRAACRRSLPTSP